MSERVPGAYGQKTEAMSDENPYRPPSMQAPDAGEASAIVRWTLAFLVAFGLFWVVVVPCSMGVFLLEPWADRAQQLPDTDAPSLALLVVGLYLGYWYIIPLATLF
jgi:hypothetical protein